MHWLSDPVNFFFVLGIALIVFELAVMQLTTFWFLYVGLGALITALILWILPSASWVAGVTLFVIATAVVTLAINRPLRRWQNKPGAIAGNDAVGQTVEVIETISADNPGKVRWSGTEWDAELEEGADTIAADSKATIVAMHDITLTVK
tara:strand:+ start:79 stop:525 length:447 start_codon:yes stop_codon:yes gene_type:complete